MSEKLLNELIATYRTTQRNDSLELEIRFKDIDRTTFEQIYNALCEHATPEFEFSINTISNDANEKSRSSNASLIRRMLFKNGVRVDDSYLQKTSLMRPIKFSEFLKYTVSLASETAVPKFTPNGRSLVRIKSRAMFIIGRWRYDLTAVKTGILDEIGDKLKDVVAKYSSATLADYISTIDFDYFDNLELEAEFINKMHAPATPINMDDIVNATRFIFEKINAKYAMTIQYQNEIYHIATRIFEHKSYQDQFRTKHGLKRLSNAVIALDKNSYYEIYPPIGYYLTDKADGIRCVVSIHGNRCALITSSECRIIELPADAKDPIKEVILDCEMLGTLDEPTLYVFDCMLWCKVLIGGFADRLAIFDEAVAYVAELTKLQIMSKKFTKLGIDLEKAFRGVYEAKYPYEIDGLIITEPGKRYTDTHNYKWKSYDHNTIDFLAIKCPAKLMGVKPYIAVNDMDLYILFVGVDNQYREKLGLGFMHGYKQLTSGMIDDGNYIPIQFSPSAAPLAYIYYHPIIGKNNDTIDGKIVELRRNADNTKWEFLRVREDRKMERGYYGNDFRIAELTYMNYVDRFDLSALWQENVGYFTKTASTMHTAPNRFKRFVISDLLKNQLAGSNWIIDEASGRGADIHRYQEIGVKNALFIEIDPTAVAELIRRKFEYVNRQQHRKPHRAMGAYESIRGVDIQKVIEKDNKNLTCNVMVSDLKTDAAVMLQRIADFGIVAGTIDGIVCNFALHYMCDTVEHIRNLLTLNATLLKQGGLFMFTVMDGAKIFKLLAAGDYKSYQDDVLKYSIKKMYKSDKLMNAGQIISVLMPFSDKHYDEPLCNVEFVISEAAKLGFAFELNESFSSYFTKFTSADKLLGEQLTDDDHKYIDLYHFITLRLVKKPKF